MVLGRYLKSLGKTLSRGYKLWKDTGRYTKDVREDTIPEGSWENLFSSDGFFKKTQEAVERTRSTGKERGYDIRKKIGENKYTINKTNKGSKNSVKIPYSVGNLKDYELALFHTHPQESYLLPSSRDLRVLNRQNRMTNGKSLSLIATHGENQAQIIAIKQKGNLPPLPFQTKRLSRKIAKNYNRVVNEGSDEHPLILLTKAIKKTGKYDAIPMFLEYSDGKTYFDPKALEKF